MEMKKGIKLIDKQGGKRVILDVNTNGYVVSVLNDFNSVGATYDKVKINSMGWEVE